MEGKAQLLADPWGQETDLLLGVSLLLLFGMASVFLHGNRGQCREGSEGAS